MAPRGRSPSFRSIGPFLERDGSPSTVPGHFPYDARTMREMIGGRSDNSQLNAERDLAHLILCAFPLDRGVAAPRPAAGGWPLIAQAAEANGLAPMLYAALKKLDCLDEISPDIAERLRVSYLRTSVGNWCALQELASLLALFEREQVPVVLLKGSALITTLYADAALRPLSDLDVLVPDAALPRVRSLLVGRGFEPNEEAWYTPSQPLAQELTFNRGGKRPATIDVHWHLLSWAYYREATSIDWFWQRTTEARLNERVVQVFSPEAQLLHLVAHCMLHRRPVRLLWSYDVALLLARYGAQMSWNEVIEMATKFRLGLVLRAGLLEVGSRWGVHAPADVMASLGAMRPTAAERAVFRVASARHRELQRLANVLCLPGPGTKLASGLRVIFPRLADVQTRRGVANAWLIPWCYLSHMFSIMGKTWRSAVSIIQTNLEASR
ncbi:MAG: nucleotidyltransferase family protein [Chloroflexi bacterium]|nr:nucleotidyltransferase family protein [Chloroflexota bacterium]